MIIIPAIITFLNVLSILLKSFEVVASFLKSKRDFSETQQAILDAGGSAFHIDGVSLIVSPNERSLAASRISALQHQELPTFIKSVTNPNICTVNLMR